MFEMISCLLFVHLWLFSSLATACDEMGVVLDGPTIRTFNGISLNDCWNECANRPSCLSINFRPIANVCFLKNANKESNDLEQQLGFVYRQKSSQEPINCGPCTCQDGETCNTMTNVCEIRECPPLLEKSDVTILGNMWSIGSKAILKCQSGYIPLSSNKSTVAAVCGSNGVWSEELTCEPARTTTSAPTTSTTAPSTATTASPITTTAVPTSTATASPITTTAVPTSTATASPITTTAPVSTTASTTVQTNPVTYPPCSCPPDDTVFRTVSLSDHSLLTYRVFKTLANQSEASANCLSQGGFLVRVTTIAKINTLLALANCTGYSINDYYVDGSNAQSGPQWDTWITSNNVSIPMSNDFWGVGYPSNPAIEHCIRMCAAHGYKFNDITCSSLYFYICEK